MKIVMFHYVRPLPDLRYPDIKGRSLMEFETQLSNIAASGEQIWSVPDLIDLAEVGRPVPEEGWLLTFDDGLRDHREYALDLLDSYAMRGGFFVCGAPLAGAETMRVQKLQVLFASGAPPEEVLGAACHFLSQSLRHEELEAALASARRHATTNDLDDAATAEAKYLMQSALPAGQAGVLLDSLLQAFGCKEDPELHAEMYLQETDLREISGAGHFVGPHGFLHERYGMMTEGDVLGDMAASISALGEIGLEISQTAMAYPYGSAPLPNVLSGMRDLGIVVGFTTEQRATSKDDEWLLLPRLDTNYFPPTPTYGRRPGS